MTFDRYRGLWWGVIAQALVDVLEPQRDHPAFEERVDAYHWLVSDSDEINSFLWVCDVTDLDPELPRRRLREAGLL